jgi:hypothetical protein
MKGHELIAKTTINDKTVELFGTPYVYSRDSKDIDIKFEEVGFFESTIESGFLLDNALSIPQVHSALTTSVALIDTYLETTDDTWENKVVQGDMKIEVESGAMGRNIMVKYYYGTDEDYSINALKMKGYEKPKRKDVRYGW